MKQAMIWFSSHRENIIMKIIKIKGFIDKQKNM